MKLIGALRFQIELKRFVENLRISSPPIMVLKIKKKSERIVYVAGLLKGRKYL